MLAFDPAPLPVVREEVIREILRHLERGAGEYVEAEAARRPDGIHAEALRRWRARGIQQGGTK